MRILWLIACALILLAAILLALDAPCRLASWRGGVVLLCPATDPIRLWPLPPVMPWPEDPGGQFVGRLAIFL